MAITYYDMIFIKHGGAYDIAEFVDKAKSAQLTRIRLISYQTDDLRWKIAKGDRNSLRYAILWMRGHYQWTSKRDVEMLGGVRARL